MANAASNFPTKHKVSRQTISTGLATVEFSQVQKSAEFTQGVNRLRNLMQIKGNLAEFKVSVLQSLAEVKDQLDAMEEELNNVN